MLRDTNGLPCRLVTATRDRRSDLDTEPRTSSWGDAPAFGSRAMPWWGAVLTALALTAVGALFNELTSKALGLPFQALYTLGCVLAVTFVRRRSLFGPMVQPPLIMIIVAGVVLTLFAGGTGGLAAKAIAVGPPLIGNFPVMAIATVITVVIGAIRLILQRKPKFDDDEEFPPAARSVRRDPPSRDDREIGRDREPPRREPAPRPAAGRTRPTPPPPGRDREHMDRDRQPPPPQRQVPPNRGGAPGRPAPGAGGQRGVPPRPAAPGRGGGGRPGGGGQGRPPQPPPRRPRRPDDDY